jgi:microcystin-dependent protein
MATVTASYNWVSGETVTPTKLNSTAAPTVVVADGEVTVAKLAAAVQQLLVPAGAVQAFAMNAAPTGWLAADGTAVSRSTYAALFAAISTTYGAGDGSTTFALPDLRGIFVRGSGSQTIASVTYSGGAFGGKQGDSFRSHAHGVTDAGHTHNVTTFQNTNNISAGGAIQGFANFNTGNTQANAATSNTTGISINSTGGAETAPANITLLYCIKF